MPTRREGDDDRGRVRGRGACAVIVRERRLEEFVGGRQLAGGARRARGARRAFRARRLHDRVDERREVRQGRRSASSAASFAKALALERRPAAEERARGISLAAVDVGSGRGLGERCSRLPSGELDQPHARDSRDRRFRSGRGLRGSPFGRALAFAGGRRCAGPAGAAAAVAGEAAARGRPACSAGRPQAPCPRAPPRAARAAMIAASSPGRRLANPSEPPAKEASGAGPIAAPDRHADGEHRRREAARSRAFEGSRSGASPVRPRGRGERRQCSGCVSSHGRLSRLSV